MKNTTFDIKSKVKELSEFITNRDIKEFRIKIDARQHIIFKIKLTDNVDQVFSSYHYCTNNDHIEKYGSTVNNGTATGLFFMILSPKNYCVVNLYMYFYYRGALR